MSPQLQQVLHEIEQLTKDEQLEVISHTTEQLKCRAGVKSQIKRSWRELRGIAPNLLDGKDAQQWVNELRNEWDEREVRRLGDK
jgi:hypothetical protein